MKRFFLAFLVSFFIISGLFSCRSAEFQKHKDLKYTVLEVSEANDKDELTVFSPRHASGFREVLIFVHGGSWKSGRKELYNYLGRRFAEKGIVTVLIDYPLSPEAKYDQMAASVASAVKWVKANIKGYGGNPDQVYISGHSAGGHLAALVATDPEYLETTDIRNYLKGCILIDAFGLDIHYYLQAEKENGGKKFLQTFTTDSLEWKKASPVTYLDQQALPFLIYQGEKTYPGIIKDNQRFLKALKAYRPGQHLQIVEGKKHISMITQFFNSNNPLYEQIIDFIKEDGQTSSKIKGGKE